MNKSYNFFKSIKKYKYHLIKIIYFELLFIIKGYGILKLDKSKNRDFTDNIPCPYYFLDKIAKEKRVNFKNFDFFYDLGCGYGRVINFFRKKFSNLNIIGIEYDKNYSDYCCKKFFRYSNVKIIDEN